MLKDQGLYLSEYEHENCGAGFICNLNGERSNQIIHSALEILVKLEHRGGVSADGKTGDGAGLLIDIPHQFFKRVCDFDLPQPRDYAVGMIFLPRNDYSAQESCKTIVGSELTKNNFGFLPLTLVLKSSIRLDSSYFLYFPYRTLYPALN